jgi:chemotaxis signal transduction protein
MVEFGFIAENLHEYFPVEDRYQLPNIHPSCQVVTQLRGQAIPLIDYWRLLAQHWNLNLFRGDVPKIDDFSAALLFELKGELLGFPVAEVTELTQIDPNQLRSFDETRADQELVYYDQHCLIIDPQAVVLALEQSLLGERSA